VILADVSTGGITPLRTEAVDEPPIDTLKVSPLKYLINFQLLFEIHANFQAILCAFAEIWYL
jgi:hypothetical protein